jgi:hypothetical protein
VKPAADKDSESEPKRPTTPDGNRPPTNRPSLTGTLQSFIDLGHPVSGRIVTSLGKGLGFSLQDDAASVVAAYDKHRRNARQTGPGGRRRPGGGRRELLQEITAKWPELGDAKRWEESPLLKPDNQEQLLAELKQLPAWKSYDQRRLQTVQLEEQSERHELREVKFRRLISTLETIVLEKHLPHIAAPEVVERYRQLIRLEESALGSTEWR